MKYSTIDETGQDHYSFLGEDHVGDLLRHEVAGRESRNRRAKPHLRRGGSLAARPLGLSACSMVDLIKVLDLPIETMPPGIVQIVSSKILDL